MIATIIVTSSCQNNDRQTIDLSGEWQFQMDPEDQGVDEKWFESDFSEIVQLPGSMVENEKGYEITMETKWTGGMQNPEWYNDPNYAPYIDPNNVRFPFWLQPEKKYTGAAWYRKRITIPTGWQDKIVRLTLERPHWESTVWVNGEPAGMQNSLAVAHIYNVSPYLKEGENVLTVRIDNRTKDIDVGENAHSISDHTQSNWNGIVGDISLSATGKITFENVEIFPDITEKSIEIRATVNNTLRKEQTATFTADARLKKSGKSTGGKLYEFRLTPGDNIITMDYQLGEKALLWDEFNPNVYELLLTLKSENETDDYTTDFGLRDFKVDGTRFAINGRPVFLRGTLECAIFPLTGYPPTDTDYWKKIYTAVKEHGLNHVRFHSWCPPKAAFIAADEMGVYLQPECSSWANIGNGMPIDQYIWDESRHIVKAYGNHPSFVMMAYG
ncbi:MAG: beta-glucuronidase, partial [Rhodothermaceae bacterium]|nr:beta-glucuronidase [Rhodothermaceae bacterium]